MTPRRQLAPVLSSAEADKIFKNDIFPAIGANGPRVAKPTLVIVGGQAGSGKSTTIRRMAERLGKQSTQKIIVDDLLCFLPDYYEASRRDARRAQDEVGLDPGLWANELKKRAFDGGVNILVEAALGASVSLAREARTRGYRTEMHVIATPRQQSFAAMLDRFDRALAKGSVAGSAIGNKREHDKLYRKWPRNLYEAEESKAFDRIVVARRDGHVLYENELVDKGPDLRWKYSPRAVEALLEERHRLPTAAEARELRETWNRIAKSDRLAADPFTQTLPLSEYQRTAIADIENRCRSFGPSQLEAANREATDVWYRFLADDLRAYLPSDGRRDGFTEQIHAYLRKAAQKGLRVIHTEVAPRTAESPDASLPTQDEQSETMRSPAATFEKPVKRLKTSATIKTTDAYGSFDLSPATAERLESEALAWVRGSAGQNVNIGGGARVAELQDVSSISAYGSLDLSPAAAERLERAALASAGGGTAENGSMGSGARVAEPQDVSSISAYGSLDLSPADAERLESEALAGVRGRATQNENIGSGVRVTGEPDVLVRSRRRELDKRAHDSISR